MKTLVIYDTSIDGGLLSGKMELATGLFEQANIEIEIFLYDNDKLLANKIALIKNRKYKKIAIIAGQRIAKLIISLLKENNLSIPIALFNDNESQQHIYFNKKILLDELINFSLADEYNLIDFSFVNCKCFRRSCELGGLMNIDRKLNRIKRLIGPAKDQPITVKIAWDEGDLEVDILYLMVEPISGERGNYFAVTLIKDCSHLEAITLGRAIQRGEKIDSPYLMRFTTEKLAIESKKETQVLIDGEAETTTSLEFVFAEQQIYLKHLSLQADDVMLSHRLTTAIYDFNHLSFVNNFRKNILIDLLTILWDIRRHNPFSYCNRKSIPEEYFTRAEQTLDDGFLYLVLADSGSPAAEVVSYFTKRTFSHISISFDPYLDTIASYNGGLGLNRPGLHAEDIHYFYQKPDASIIIYKMPATYQQKSAVLNEIRRINDEGSSYNFLGWNAEGRRENIMFCSQFVYHTLEKAGLLYFERDPARVRPSEFVELDHNRQLTFCCSFYLHDLLNNSYLLEDDSFFQESKHLHLLDKTIDFRKAR